MLITNRILYCGINGGHTVHNLYVYLNGKCVIPNCDERKTYALVYTGLLVQVEAKIDHLLLHNNMQMCVELKALF